MAFDPPTILTLTIAIAAAAAIYLLLEWRSACDGSLLSWSAGFATVTVGSSLSLLRANGHFPRRYYTNLTGRGRDGPPFQ